MGSGWAPAADAFGTVEGSVAIGGLPGFAAPTAVGHGGEVRSVRGGDRRAGPLLRPPTFFLGRGGAPGGAAARGGGRGGGGRRRASPRLPRARRGRHVEGE